MSMSPESPLPLSSRGASAFRFSPLTCIATGADLTMQRFQMIQLMQKPVALILKLKLNLMKLNLNLFQM